MGNILVIVVVAGTHTHHDPCCQMDCVVYACASSSSSSSLDGPSSSLSCGVGAHPTCHPCPCCPCRKMLGGWWHGLAPWSLSCGASSSCPRPRRPHCEALSAGGMALHCLLSSPGAWGMQWRGSGGGSIAWCVACPIVLVLVGWRRERIVVVVVVRYACCHHCCYQM